MLLEVLQLPARSGRPDGRLARELLDFLHEARELGGDASGWTVRHRGRPPPTSSGVFIGDYQGLEADGTGFVAFFTETNTGNTDNRTDIFSETVTTS